MQRQIRERAHGCSIGAASSRPNWAKEPLGGSVFTHPKVLPLQFTETSVKENNPRQRFVSTSEARKHSLLAMASEPLESLFRERRMPIYASKAVDHRNQS